MMPVRSELQVVGRRSPGSLSSAMNMVGTPYSEVQRSAATACRVACGSNPGPGMTMVAPLVVQPQVAHHHAEAVVEGHRDAHPVVRGVAAEPADEVAVVQDVVVAQRRALGEAGGARGVLDVDRVVRAELGLQPGQLVPVAGPSRLDQRVPVRCPDQHHLAQLRAVRPDLLDHRGVVGGLEAGRRDQHRDPGLVEHELQLVGAVGRVDVDQDHADLGRGELHQGPLGARSAPRCPPGRPCPARPRATRRPASRRPRAARRRSSGARSAPRPWPRRRAARRPSGPGCRRWCRRAAARRRSRRRRTGTAGAAAVTAADLSSWMWCGPHPAAVDRPRPPPPDGEAGKLGLSGADTLGRCMTRASCSIPPPTPSAGWPAGATPWTPPPWRSCCPRATRRSSAGDEARAEAKRVATAVQRADADGAAGAGGAGPRAQGRLRGGRGGAPGSWRPSCRSCCSASRTCPATTSRTAPPTTTPRWSAAGASRAASTSPRSTTSTSGSGWASSTCPRATKLSGPRFAVLRGARCGAGAGHRPVLPRPAHPGARLHRVLGAHPGQPGHDDRHRAAAEVRARPVQDRRWPTGSCS